MDENIKNTYGTSILVPSVQELAKQKFSTVPPRYIQPQQNDLVTSEPDGVLEIPVIDLQRLISIESGSSELAKLHLACKEWGFFQLVNHGVSSSLLEKVKLEIQEFFNLPMLEKRKFWQTPEHVEGFGQAFVVSEEQKLDWADIFFMTTLPKHMRVPHLFPQLPLPLRDTLEFYSQEINNLAMVIIYQLGKALRMEEMEMREFFEDGKQSMRMNYYPPCPQPEKVIGLTPHSDAAGLTILLQVNEVEGLQIRKDGNWVPVKPLPNAFIVNIADVMEVFECNNNRKSSLTVGFGCMVYYPSDCNKWDIPKYRASSHSNSGNERLSIATFHNARHDGMVGPAPSLIAEQTPARFKRIGFQGYRRGLFSRKLDGKSYLDVMRIEHQD